MKHILMAWALLAPLAASDLTSAIRVNDLEAVKQLARAAMPDETIHYAASRGSIEALKIVLDAGAPVNAKNRWGGTALMLAVADPAKVKLLLQRGADAKLASNQGRTALIAAGEVPGAIETLKMLLAAGADPMATDFLGVNALMTAASAGNAEGVKLLLARGVPVNTPSKGGDTALAQAYVAMDEATIAALLAAGADVNAANAFSGQARKGPIKLTKLTPLALAAPYARAGNVERLLKAGAKVDVQDTRGLTPLMTAIASDHADPAVAGVLLKAGAKLDTKDPQHGRTAADWAALYQHPAILRQLKNAPHVEQVAVVPTRPKGLAPAAPAEAIRQAMSLLEKSTDHFFRESGCVGCHHQAIGARAAAATGLNTPRFSQLFRDALVAETPSSVLYWQLVRIAGDIDTVIHSLAGAHAAQVPSSDATDSYVHLIAARQQADGSWQRFGVDRSPIEADPISTTALSVYGLTKYGWPARKAEFDERIARARAWLLQAKPVTNYDRAELLLGLLWSGAPRQAIAERAKDLLAQQRSDGGWSQTAYLRSDAYATGLALYALHEVGQLKADAKAYRRGARFLLSTQLADGSWYVRSRSPRFQPYFESGFPHGHDQWISASATAYAAMALAPVAR